MSVAALPSLPRGPAAVAYLCVMVLLTELASGPITVIVDAINHAREEDYGKQRLWGAVVSCS